MGDTSNEQNIDVLLDSVTNEEPSMNKTLEILNEIPTDILSNYVNHPFFTQNIPFQLEELLQKWSNMEITWDTNDSKLFYNINYLIFRLSKSKILIESVLQCAISPVAQQTLFDLCAPILTQMEQFLLVSCPNYILKCDQVDGKYSQSMFKNMLRSYINKCTRSDDFIKFYPICFITPFRLIAFNIHSMELEDKQYFTQPCIQILETGLHNSNKDIDWMSLVYSAVRILLDIARFESQLLNDLRESNQSLNKIIYTLKQLTNDTQNDQIRLQVFELIVLILPEEQVPRTIDPKQVAGLFVNSSNQILTNNDDLDHEELKEIRTELFYGLKSLSQNRILSEELVQANILPLLINYAEESPDDAMPLEIIYALMFNENCKNELIDDKYKSFIDYIRQLQKSVHTNVQQAATGILWKIDGEEMLKNRNESPQIPSVLPWQSCPETSIPYGGAPMAFRAAAMESNYHLMISYCWANKPICQQIYARLQTDGYRVWIDQNEMHGSIVERMAEGIEKSDLILICMSSGYKKSSNCQAEAEYAFNRKKTIVPLIVETKYKADGWLGFIAGNKIYVNFAEKIEQEFENTYANLIVELERNGLTLSNSNDAAQESNESVLSRPNIPAFISEDTYPPPVNNRYDIPPYPIPRTEYRNVAKINNWNEKHVVEFLRDYNLNGLIKALQGINGEGLLELYHVYERSPEMLYRILNNNDQSCPPGVFFKFITVLKNFLVTSQEYSYF